MTKETRGTFFSERMWPIVRVVALQMLLMTGIIGGLVAILVFTILVDADFDLYLFDSNGRYITGSWGLTSVEQLRNFANYCGRFIVGVHAYRGSGSYVLTCNTRWKP